MNKSVLMIMGGALVVAIFVAMIVQAKLSPKDDKVGAGPSTEILVATKKLLTGERVLAENVRWQTWPEAAAFKGVIKKSEHEDGKDLDIYDTPLRRDVEAGEPLTMGMVIADAKGGGNFLAASIEPGMRAVAVNVKANTSAGGFISPGDHVDLILTYSSALPDSTRVLADSVISRYASQTILNNVKVLAVDQTSKGDGSDVKIAKTVTLEVSREGQEIVALASSMGELSLSLRRLGEKDKPDDLVTPITTDVTTSEVIRKINQLMEKSRTNSSTVRIYSGTGIQNIPVRAKDAADRGNDAR